MVDALDGFAVLLIALAVVNIGATSVLVWAALRHRWPALEERATVAVILALVSVAGALLGLNRLQIVVFPVGLAPWILVGVLIAVSVPSMIWLVAYWSGRFDEA